MSTSIQLNGTDLVIAAVLLLIEAAISVPLRLRIYRQVLLSALRMVIQLLIVGIILRFVFASNSLLVTVPVIVFMIGAAASEVALRPKQRLVAHGNYRISLTIVSFAGIATVLLGLLTAIRPDPWYAPRYAIPLAGIVLGAVLNGGSIALDALLEGVIRERVRIETSLSLGATIREALSPLTRDAVRRAMIPVVNQMSAAGIITLPGTMTGQMLAGMDPMQAVKYQILLMLLLAGATGAAAIGAAFLSLNFLTDDRQRLRLDRLRIKNN